MFSVPASSRLVCPWLLRRRVDASIVGEVNLPLKRREARIKGGGAYETVWWWYKSQRGRTMTIMVYRPTRADYICLYELELELKKAVSDELT